MKKILFILLIIFGFIGSSTAITINTNNNLYRTVERTNSDTITITSDDGAATTHWILNGVDLGTNVLTQAITYNIEQYNNLTIYQTNGPLTSNQLNFIIIVRPNLVNSKSTKINTSLTDNFSNAITNNNFTEIMSVPKDYYINTMGLFFYLFVWAIYAGMLYIRQNKWHIPAILLILLSTIIMSELPDQYRGLIKLGTIAGAFAVIYLFTKSKSR